MYGKKQRIISFLMAFLLIFTFAFINPLTVQKADAFAFAPVLTQGMARIITGVLVSAGYIIHEGTTATADYDVALQNMSRVIYQTLDNAQKLLLGALSIVDNIVEVPVSLYNSIVNKANSVLRTDTTTTLSEQGISIRYSTLKPTNTSYPTITIPLYYATNYFATGTFTERKMDLREAQPYFVYKGIDSAESNILYEEGINYYFLNVFDESLPTATIEGKENAIFLTPDMSPYELGYGSSGSTKYYINYEYIDNSTTSLKLMESATAGTSLRNNTFFTLDSTKYTVNDCNIYTYFVYYNNYLYSVMDIYLKSTGEFFNQVIQQVINSYGMPKAIYDSRTITTPYDYDITFEPDTTTTIVPPVTNTAGDNVITLPSELSGTIGATSTDVNVSTGTGEGSGTNTETMENINTNVGELVTGGELGEQINTNIGTVEGLHGELTDKADFTGLMDVLAEYISFMDISAISWLTTAIPLIVTPFIPFISLGMILFFIDRVLNGGA